MQTRLNSNRCRLNLGVWPFSKKRDFWPLGTYAANQSCQSSMRWSSKEFPKTCLFFSVSGLKNIFKGHLKTHLKWKQFVFFRFSLRFVGIFNLKHLGDDGRNLRANGPFDFFWPRSTGLGKLQRRDLAEVVLEYCRCGWLEFFGEHLWWKKTCPTFWVGEKPIETWNLFFLPKR